MKIAVGYDGSGPTSKIIQVAIAHANAFNATLCVLTSKEAKPGVSLDVFEKAKKNLEKIKKEFKENGIDCEIHLLTRTNTPGEDLVQFAKDNNVEEIIVGIEKTSKVGKLFFGSTAQFTILEAPCPVLTVK
jgi:nucleotide-binding universal stress UspA family protein